MLHGLALGALQRLTRGMDAGEFRAWVVAFFDRIAELDRISRRENRRPVSQDDLERLDLPLDAGRGVLLYRPSVGGMNWLRTRAAEWWGGDVRRYTLALAYVCAHRDKESIVTVRRRVAAWLRIKAWAIGTRVSEEALRRAAIALLPPSDDSLRWYTMPEDGDCADADIDLSAIAAAIAEKMGGTAEHWLWETSDDDFWGAWCGMMDKAEAYDRDHENPRCWWRRQRRALLKVETALQEDTAAWLAERRARAAEKAAGRARKAGDASGKGNGAGKAEDAPTDESDGNEEA